jgi:predicted DNA-binding transcriptional regulator AlpA
MIDMSAMRKVKFAVLESSLLARKGAARPAMSPAMVHDETVLEEPAYVPPARAEAAEPEAMLASLINRPVVRPVAEPAPEPVATSEPTAAPEPVAAAPAAAQAEVPAVEEVRAWTRKVAKDRRLAANLHPRGLNRDQAAQYVGLSVTTFNRLVDEGVLPLPLHFGRRRVWDRRALDLVLDRLSGVATTRPSSTDDA